MGRSIGISSLLVEKGFVKVKRIRRSKLRYSFTPEGIALRAKSTLAYVQQAFSLFREVQRRVRNLLRELQEKGIQAVRLVGDGDIAKVCTLTFLKQHITLTEAPHAPALVVEELEVRLEFDETTNTN